MASEPPAISPEDSALLDRLAERVIELRLEVPAILTIESGKPLSLIAGQAMLFFEPLVQSIFKLSDYGRYASLIERREALDELVRRIESRADAARESRTAALKAAPKRSGND
jgi:hypothetical protein